MHILFLFVISYSIVIFYYIHIFWHSSTDESLPSCLFTDTGSPTRGESLGHSKVIYVLHVASLTDDSDSSLWRGQRREGGERADIL